MSPGLTSELSITLFPSSIAGALSRFISSYRIFWTLWPRVISLFLQQNFPSEFIGFGERHREAGGSIYILTQPQNLKNGPTEYVVMVRQSTN